MKPHSGPAVESIPVICAEHLSEIAADYDDWAITLEALGDRYAADAKGRELAQITRKAQAFRAKAADLRRCRDAMQEREEAHS